MNTGVLSGLSQLKGVLGASLLSDSGELQDAACKPPYDGVLFERTFPRLRAAMDNWEVTGEDAAPKTLQAGLDQGFVFLREIGGQESWVMVLTDRTISVPQLNVALNVLESRLDRDGGRAQSSGPKRIPSKQTSGASKTAHTSPLETNEILRKLHGNRPGFVDRSAMEHLLKVARRFLGEKTASVVSAQMRTLKISPSMCSSADFRELIAGVAQQMGTPDDARKFESEVLGDI
jgi:hypothetical protein